MERLSFRVIAGRPVKEPESPASVWMKSTSTAIQVLSAVTFALILATLMGCDGELERLQAEAEWNAKVVRTVTPEKGELVTIRQFADGQFIVRKYQGGLKGTDILARDQ